MISFFPTGYVATATRGNLDGIYRMLPYGGAFAGGTGEWTLYKTPISWDVGTGPLNVGDCGVGGACGGGWATYPPRFGFPPAGGVIGGGKAKYPLRYEQSVTGGIVGGAAKFPARFVTRNADGVPVAGGAISGRYQAPGYTDWRFRIGFCGALSGAVIGGKADYWFIHWHSIQMAMRKKTYSFDRTDTTKSFTRKDL